MTEISDEREVHFRPQFDASLIYMKVTNIIHMPISMGCLKVKKGLRRGYFRWGAWGSDNRKRSKKLNDRNYLGRTWNEMPTDA